MSATRAIPTTRAKAPEAGIASAGWEVEEVSEVEAPVAVVAAAAPVASTKTIAIAIGTIRNRIRRLRRLGHITTATSGECSRKAAHPRRVPEARRTFHHYLHRLRRFRRHRGVTRSGKFKFEVRISTAIFVIADILGHKPSR